MLPSVSWLSRGGENKKDMGNCVTVYKNKDPADMDLSARIQSPIKENNVRREPSSVGYDSRLQPSSMERETSFPEMGMFLTCLSSFLYNHGLPSL